MRRGRKDAADDIKRLIERGIKVIVKIQYRDASGSYTGRSYAYTTTLPLAVGDIVSAPTYKGDSPAKVCETHIVPDALDPALAGRLKSITSYYEEGAEDDVV